MAAYLACQSVAGVGVFPRHIWHKTSFIPTCVKSRSLPVNKARWRNHVTDLRWVQYSWLHGSASRDRSSSQCDGPVPPGPAGWRLGREAWLSSRLGEGWRVVSAGDESAGGHDSAANDEPEIVDDPAGVADPAHDDDDPAGVCWPSTWWWRPSRRLLTQHMMLTTQQAFADPAHDVDDPAHAPEEVFQLPAKRLGDGSSKSKRTMTTQEVRGFQRVCGQLRRVRTPQIKKWVSQARGDEPVVQATPAGNTPAAR